MSTVERHSEARYSRGAKIVLLISILAVPIQLLTSVLISRVSPEAAGTLGIVELFYGAIITFFLFGGETAVVKLVSDIEEPDRKRSFILFYVALCVGYFILFAVFFRFVQVDVVKIIIGSENSTSLLMYMVGILIVIHNILLSCQKEKGQFLDYSVGTKLFNFVMLFASIYIYILDQGVYGDVFYFAMLIGYLIFIPFTVKRLGINMGDLKGIKPSEYKFFGYAIFLYASTIVAFLFDRMDQIMLINKFGLATLGGYYLMVKLTNMVKLVPNIYNSTFYPYFCKVLNKDNANKLCKSLLNRNLLVIVPAAVFFLFHTEWIINTIFGNEYSEYATVLQLFILILVIGAPGMVLNNCLFALGKSKQYFMISSFSVLFQLVAMFPLSERFGIEGLVFARVFAFILIIALSILYLRKQGYYISLPIRFYIYSICLSFFTLVNVFMEIPGTVNVALSVIILCLFIYKNREGYKEMILR